MEAQQVHYLNLEYLLLRVYDLFSGVDAGSIPDWLASFAVAAVITGIALSLILLVLVVYANIKLIQVQQDGYQKLREEARLLQSQGTENTGKNDRWEHIVGLANSPNPSDWRLAILEADIMLGDVLNEQGYVGPMVGDQLKAANPLQMTTLDLAWKAHKVRNDIAHEGEALALNERDVRATIDYYRRVFEEFDAI